MTNTDRKFIAGLVLLLIGSLVLYFSEEKLSNTIGAIIDLLLGFIFTFGNILKEKDEE